jgi:uncharacterized membrane protein YebE (DUF533 family)
MIDVNKLLTAVMSGGQSAAKSGAQGAHSLDRGGRSGVGDFLSGNAGALGAGALAGGLATALLSSKQARKLAGGALQVGGVALLGGLAYQAYNNYRSGKPMIPQSVSDMLGGLIPGAAGASQQGAPQGAPPAASGGFLSAPVSTPRDGGDILLLRAMIASAMADGRIDDVERARLIERVDANGLSAEERRYLESLIARPDTPDQLAAATRGPEEAARVYLAAFVAIDADTPAEIAWLDDLASKLRLDPALRRNIESVALG